MAFPCKPVINTGMWKEGGEWGGLKKRGGPLSFEGFRYRGMRKSREGEVGNEQYYLRNEGEEGGKRSRWWRCRRDNAGRGRCDVNFSAKRRRRKESWVQRETVSQSSALSKKEVRRTQFLRRGGKRRENGKDHA